MSSKYWDDFERREKETIDCIQKGVIFPVIPVRRVAIYITKRCNFRCTYCHVDQNPISITKSQFDNVVKTFGKDAILHITGGEPSCVPWLYEYIDSHWGYKFNLNTNAFLTPPKNVTRMKISFDTCDEDLFNKLVGVDAFDTVIYNIQEAYKNSLVSLTCVLSKQTYNKTIELARYCNKHFKGLYALFFSLYKGTDPNLLMTEEDIDTFYDRIRPLLQDELNTESLELLNETLDRKIRLQQGVRFPENDLSQPCYISMSERVIAPDGNMYLCSHLYRDGIMEYNPIKHTQCSYGCNTRLVKFNNDVHRGITNVR